MCSTACIAFGLDVSKLPQRAPLPCLGVQRQQERLGLVPLILRLLLHPQELDGHVRVEGVVCRDGERPENEHHRRRPPRREPPPRSPSLRPRPRPRGH
ncbi:Os02g0730725 [Oryza sativa Japonica Group]|uniref:Os02g0730725 protein n=1 Tax=Oryza sativa subsp. japonica TaxID=39947 RepID=A0A0P0VP13_ORYSJ|nr:hypothetical protein EE612_013462 [Oryza sativa]BAS80748.1 Os02g0730725 [Oryza sativa Japonica Group]